MEISFLFDANDVEISFILNSKKTDEDKLLKKQWQNIKHIKRCIPLFLHA